jgi:peptidoglycan/LPS O-acetylase OafA/YrhL
MTSLHPSRKDSSEDDNPRGFSHLPALDGIRGLAVLLVLADHLVSWKGHSGRWIVDVLAEVHSFSWVGVNLFFALSGFLITGILVDTLDNPNFFRTFYARRILRIFPLYYGFLLILLLLTKPLNLSWGGWQYFYLTYTANLALWWDKPMLLSPFRIIHLWSLQVEEQFYLIWPLVIYFCRNRSKLIRYSLLMCLAAFAIRFMLVALKMTSTKYAYLPYSLTVCCCDNLLYGCILALLLRTSRREKVLSFAPILLLVCAVPLMIERLIYIGTPWMGTVFMPTIGFSLIGIGCASLIAMALQPLSFTGRMLISPTLRFFGRYSYGLYVLHYSVYGFLSLPLYQIFVRYIHIKALSGLLAAGTVLSISLLLAVLSYHLYEVHFLKLKKYFAYRSHRQVTSIK